MAAIAVADSDAQPIPMTANASQACATVCEQPIPRTPAAIAIAPRNTIGFGP